MDVRPVDLSILIVSYNTRAMTRECLKSVYAETRDCSFEVVVVDNDSKDGSAHMISSEFPEATLYALDENLGFGRANNLAAEHATGDYFLLLNSDTVVLDRAIDRLFELARRRPEAGIYGGRSVFADGSLNPTCCWGDYTLWTELCQGVGLSAIFPKTLMFNPRSLGRWQRDSHGEVDIISGSFLMMEADLWRTLGGFDTRFFMYAEDVDLCMRARQEGRFCLFTPEAQIIHHGGGSEPDVAGKMTKLLRAKAQLYQKHWSPPKAWLGQRFLDLWVTTRLVGNRVLGDSRRAHEWNDVWKSRDAWHRVS
jgi:GT2 family glycosyltransferase